MSEGNHEDQVTGEKPCKLHGEHAHKERIKGLEIDQKRRKAEESKYAVYAIVGTLAIVGAILAEASGIVGWLGRSCLFGALVCFLIRVYASWKK